MAVNGVREYTMRAYKDLCAAINEKILDSDWNSRMVTRALWSAFASAGKQRTKVVVGRRRVVIVVVGGRDGFEVECGENVET